MVIFHQRAKEIRGTDIAVKSYDSKAKDLNWQTEIKICGCLSVFRNKLIYMILLKINVANGNKD